MKSAVITGASRGIGRALAVTLTEKFDEFYLQGRDSKKLSESAELVLANAKRCETIETDLTDTEGVMKLVNSIDTETVELLVNNAGSALVKPYHKLTLEEWNSSFALNVTAPFILMKELLPKFRKGTLIVNILSVAAKVAFPNWSSYVMTKFALDGFTKAVREELRTQGIRVVNIYPAATATEIWDSIQGEWDASAMLSPEEVAQAVLYAVSQDESTLIEEIALGNLKGNQ